MPHQLHNTCKRNSTVAQWCDQKRRSVSTFRHLTECIFFDAIEMDAFCFPLFTSTDILCSVWRLAVMNGPQCWLPRYFETGVGQFYDLARILA